MQDKTISVLTDNEQQFAKDLQLLGADTKTSKVLTYLSLVGPATSRELELSADMRQPDVSRGIKNIREFIKTETDDRHLKFIIVDPDAAIGSIYDALMERRKAEDAAYERIQKALNKSKPAKVATKPAKAKAKKSKKPAVDDDEDLTLQV